MGLWASQQKKQQNEKEELRVKDTSVDANTLSLHVICAAGFGVPQLWPQEGEEKLVGNGVSGFSEHEVKNGHTLTFKYALISLLKNLMWFLMLGESVLSKSLLAHGGVYSDQKQKYRLSRFTNLHISHIRSA